MRKKLHPGEKVKLDVGYHNESIVEVVSQSPKRLITAVKLPGSSSIEDQWEVMTHRLTPLK